MAPANDVQSIIDEGRVGPVLSDESFLEFPVLSRPFFLLATLEVVCDTPAAPQIPLCFSTTLTKSGHVSDPSSRTENCPLGCFSCFARDVFNILD